MYYYLVVEGWSLFTLVVKTLDIYTRGNKNMLMANIAVVIKRFLVSKSSIR